MANKAVQHRMDALLCVCVCVSVIERESVDDDLVFVEINCTNVSAGQAVTWDDLNPAGKTKCCRSVRCVKS